MLVCTLVTCLVSERGCQTSRGCAKRRRTRQFCHSGAFLGMFKFLRPRPQGLWLMDLKIKEQVCTLYARAFICNASWSSEQPWEVGIVIPIQQVRKPRLIHSFLGSFTHSPYVGWILGNCTVGPSWISCSSGRGEMICPAAQRGQERCPRPHSQEVPGLGPRAVPSHFARELTR